MAKRKNPKAKPRDVIRGPASPSVEDLVRSSGLIFSGTVVLQGISTVPTLPSREDFVAVRVERGLRVNPVLGNLYGKMITVAAIAPESLHVDQKSIFFTNSWIHGNGIAVKEVAHTDVKEESKVAATVARLPEFHLLDRLQSAELVALARVVKVNNVERFSFERDYPFWKAAQLRIEEVMLGKPSDSALVYFPTDDRPQWKNAPRLRERQRGIFLLHKPMPTSLSEASLGPDILLALDPADLQPESKRAMIKNLLKTIKQKRR